MDVLLLHKISPPNKKANFKKEEIHEKYKEQNLQTWWKQEEKCVKKTALAMAWNALD